MRISTQQVFISNIDNLNQSSADLFKTQQQLSTGKNVLQPSDDPLAAAQIQKFKKEIARTEQFSSNIEVSTRRLSLQETTLDQVNNLSIRLRELAIQGKNGVLTGTDRGAVASEVDEIIKQLDSLMNTKDVQGEYLFSGNKGFTEAYTLDPVTERYTFNGDDGQRFIQVGPENKIASTDSGFEIFEKVGTVPGYVFPEIEQTLGQIDDVELLDAEAYGSFMDQYGPLTFSFSAGELTVTDRTGELVTADNPSVELEDYAVSAGVELYFGGAKITIGDVNDGIATLDQNNQHNILNTALDLKEALTSFDTTTQTGKDEFNDRMDHVIANLGNIEEKNIQTRTSIGARINALEQQDLVNEDYKLFTQEALSSFEDLDYNEAISRFELQNTALQAAYASFAKVQDLSLFNYI